MRGPDTMTTRLVFLVSILAALAGCRHGRCYRSSDCHKDLICIDPDMVVGAAKRCAKDEVRCVAGCQARCTEESCGTGTVCGESGCCEPKPCKLNNDCPNDQSCVDNKCRSAGRCTEPPPEVEPDKGS
jgi:hypothetical protein